jgi:hypothetical protein
VVSLTRMLEYKLQRRLQSVPFRLPLIYSTISVSINSKLNFQLSVSVKITPVLFPGYEAMRVLEEFLRGKVEAYQLFRHFRKTAESDY